MSKADVIAMARPPYVQGVRAAADWQAEAAVHEDRLRPVLDPHLRRQSRGEKHPVIDFLFTYYTFRPARLRRWSPGFGVALAGPVPALDGRDGFARTAAGLALDPSLYPPRLRPRLARTHALLQATAARPPMLGCHGLHEWAMVYRAPDVRHNQYPLRLTADALAAVVEAQPLCCTHYDAFRFFTPPARPRNRHQLTFEAMADREQPGCLHTNMDLYRWAYKLYPWISSTLIADAFLLACRIRAVDMRASPYDLRALGYTPIPIETPEGRRTYRAYQQRFAEAAAPIRDRLIAACEYLLMYV